ncbi:MAG TPA: patatin-like phospholipase family protein [Acidobacteriaceae bacterium]|nr:patatin-like phospholipase family protein [Acidobacteriaceae bacterium]
MSLDGGGSWALIQVKALMQLFPGGANTSGRDVLKEFDLVAANSGGSIVLGCLIDNHPLGEILSLFRDEQERRSIFAATGNIGYQLTEEIAGFGPKYSAEKKLKALRHVLARCGDHALPDAVKGIAGHNGQDIQVLIAGFDYDRLRARFFRSQASGGEGYGSGAQANVTLAEAIHASTNAPVNYFDGPASFPGNPGRYWDGAITGCNNPVLAGVTEAAALTKGTMEIVALSLGTGTVALPWPTTGEEGSPYVRQPGDRGLMKDLKKLAGAILDDPPDMASYVAHVMTGGSDGLPPGGTADSRIVRMSPMISPARGHNEKWVPPAEMLPEDFQTLCEMEMDAIEQNDVDLIARYADLWLGDRAPNQPVRMDGDTLNCELGHSRFGRARDAWNEIRGD